MADIGKPNNVFKLHANKIKAWVDYLIKVFEELKKISEERAKSTRDYLTNILNDSADGILGISLDNKILLWNKGAELFFFRFIKTYGATVEPIPLGNTNILSFIDCPNNGCSSSTIFPVSLSIKPRNVIGLSVKSINSYAYIT